LSKELGVTKATVNNAIRRLQRDGLVTSQPYRAIFLTDKGEKLAKASRKRHLLVRQLLIALGVDAKTAEVDAEGMEHHVSERTLDAFRKYLALR
jgi:DtxR family manganese transport transcriptional regulator